ncbi:hypothetical protein [Mesorhizobium sp. URHB0026]
MASKFEEVAHAICEANDDDWYREGPGGLMFGYAPLARAALQALLEPSPEMWMAGSEVSGLKSSEASRAFKTMIEVILAEDGA